MNSTATVLVVDDDPFQQVVIASQLHALGCSDVLVADSGTSALVICDTHHKAIELLVCDLAMPDMDGLVLMRHLAERNLRAAVILRSGASDEILNSAAGLAHAHGLNLLGILPKPGSADELAALLGRMDRSTPRPREAQNIGLSAERLGDALRRGEFVPWFQPKIDLTTGKIIGVEALARWVSETDTMPNPGQFIPAIEQAGLADELLKAMLRQTASAIKHWRTLGYPLRAAVNLSMDSAYNLHLPEELHEVVRGQGLQPEDIVIEVTESRLMVERCLAMETLTRLSLIGFKLSIDDFGTGFSSLMQLIDLPFGELKIDASFVHRASHEQKAGTALRIAALLGKNLGMDVVAEGVETTEQLALVRECGCNIVQGYYFGRPMPLDIFTDWLIAKN